MIPTWGTSSGRNGAGGIPSLLLDFSNQSYLLNGTGYAAFGGSPGITFSRGTNATLIDSTGQLTYAPSNQIPNSESFTATTWVPTGLATTPVVSNATVAPDGTTTADSIVENTSSSNHRIDYSGLAGNSGKYAVSIYLKAGTRTFARVQFDGTLNSVSSSAAVQINLTDGTLSSTTTAGNITTATATSENVGNGWYRLGLIFTISPAYVLSGGNVRIYLMQSLVPTPTYTGNGSNIFVWGAQFGAMTYETAPRAYNSTTPKNLLGFTEEFNNAAWVKTAASVTANAIADPNGYINADKLIGNATASGHIIQQIGIASAVLGTPYTISIYVKAAGYNFAFVGLNGTAYSPAQYISINLTDGSFFTASGAPSSASVTDVGNGWYRVSVSAATTVAASAVQLDARPSADGVWANRNTAQNGTDGIYVWGAQLSDSASMDPYVYNPAAALTSTAYYGPRFDYYPNFINYSEGNIVKFPENFENSNWTKGATIVTQDQSVSPAYTLTADKVAATSVNTEHYVRQTLAITTGSTIVASVYVKASGYTAFRIRCLNSAIPANGFFGTVDTATGLTAGGGAGIGTLTSISATDVGNGWFLLTVIGNAGPTAASLIFDIFILSGDQYSTTIFTGNDVNGGFFWGAQVVIGSTYIPYYYYTTPPLGLLIEEARTNLLLNSATLSTQIVTTTAQAYTLSFYGTGTVTLSGTSTAGPLVGTGLFPQRASLTFTPTAGTLTLTVSGTVSNAQLEAGGFATSYIPTTSASVTRSADVATMVGNNFSNWYNQTTGTLSVAFDASANGSATYVSASNGTITQNSVHVDNEAGNMRAAYYSGSTEVAPLVLGAIGTIGATNKIATAYAVNDFAASRNGGTVATDTAGAVPVGLTQLNIGVDDRLTATFYTSNHIKSISYYNTRLTNAQLQAVSA